MPTKNIFNPYMVDEVAAGLNCKNHIFLEGPCQPQAPIALGRGAWGTMRQVTTHIVYIQAKKMTQPVRLEYCPEVCLPKQSIIPT